MAIIDELTELVAELREAMQDASSVPVPPPATEEEMAGVEAELGFLLPEEVRALYSIARDGSIGIFEITPIQHGATSAPAAQHLTKFRATRSRRCPFVCVAPSQRD